MISEKISVGTPPLQPCKLLILIFSLTTGLFLIYLVIHVSIIAHKFTHYCNLTAMVIQIYSNVTN